MIELIKALVKARGEFPPIEKDKVNPHFKMAYASLDSVLDAVTPVLCKHGLAIVHVMEKGNILKTHLFHESGEFLTSEYEIPDIQDSQKRGAAITYGRRYSICALLSITADEDDDGNTAISLEKPKARTQQQTQSTNSIVDLIREIREFLKVDKNWVIAWLQKKNTNISSLKRADEIIKDMAIDWAIVQGIDEFYALETYTENVKTIDSVSIQKWQQTLFKGEE
ncbi:MAG: ERF family protein [Dolichospermum sp.]